MLHLEKRTALTQSYDKRPLMADSITQSRYKKVRLHNGYGPTHDGQQTSHQTGITEFKVSCQVKMQKVGFVTISYDC